MAPVHGSAGVNVGYVLAQRARLGSERTAIRDADRTWTYRELDTRANRLARGLARVGVERGDRVVVMLGNRAEHYELLFACAKLGAMLVPVNYRLTRGEVRVITEDAEPRVFVHGPEYADVARVVCAGGLAAIGVDVPSHHGLTYEDLLSGEPAAEPGPVVGLDDPLIMMYTSGTTGRPKGAVLTHGNILFTSLNQVTDFAVTPDDRALAVAPLYHVGGLLILAFPCLHVGGEVTILRAFAPEAVLDAIERDRITVLFLAPTMWNMLLQEPKLGRTDLRSVRLGCSGGESLPVAVMRRLTGIFGAGFTEGYGLTEASSCSTVLRPEHVFEKTGSVGLPLLHNAIRVVDESGDDVEAGAVGEIVQAGPTVMAGYWRRPEATAAALRDGWLHTGDLGRFDEDGFLYIVDRATDMIISGAENVYPAEVEEILYKHPAVLEAAVVGLPDPDWGERVVAAVVLRTGETASAEEIVSYCRGRIAGYKRPREVFIRDSLPRNPSGKVLKRHLRATLEGPALRVVDPHSERPIQGRAAHDSP